MKQKIEAGVIADLGSLVKAISGALFKWMDKLDGRGFTVSKPSKGINGRVAFDLKTNDKKHQARVTIIPQEDNENVFDIEIKPKNEPKETLRGVAGEYISQQLDGWLNNHAWVGKKAPAEGTTEEGAAEGDTAEEVAEEATEEGATDSGEEANASTKVRFTLKKVTAGTDVQVVLTAIQSNTNLVAAHSILQDIVANDEFCTGLNPAPQTFEVLPCDDGTLDVTPCEEACTVDYTYASLMAVALNVWATLKTVHWNSIGSDFFGLHEKLDTYIGMIESEIDAFGELAMEYDNIVPNPLDMTAGMVHTVPGPGFAPDIGFKVVREAIREYIGAMECAYVNCPHDVQSELDTYIRYWSKEAEYKLRRQQTASQPMPQ